MEEAITGDYALIRVRFGCIGLSPPVVYALPVMEYVSFLFFFHPDSNSRPLGLEGRQGRQPSFPQDGAKL